MSGLGLTFLRRGGQSHPTAGSDYIRFADAEVLRVLMANGVSSDGVGITKEDAAKVTSIGVWFRYNAVIKSFLEFAYFTKVKEIDATAFRTCTSLEEIKFPPSVESVGANAFMDCTALKSADIANAYSLDSGSFRNCPLLNLNFSQTRLWLNSVTGGGIARESGIVKINAPLLEDMGSTDYTCHFQNCVQLVEVENLGKITTIPGGNLNYSIFRGCTSLRKVRLPATLTNLGGYTFNQCYALEVVICEAINPPTSGAKPFNNTNDSFVIYVPTEAVDAYKSAANWNTYASQIKPMSDI